MCLIGPHLPNLLIVKAALPESCLLVLRNHQGQGYGFGSLTGICRLGRIRRTVPEVYCVGLPVIQSACSRWQNIRYHRGDPCALI